MIVICTRYTRQLSEIVNLEANRDLAQVAHMTMLSLRVGLRMETNSGSEASTAICYVLGETQDWTTRLSMRKG